MNVNVDIKVVLHFGSKYNLKFKTRASEISCFKTLTYRRWPNHHQNLSVQLITEAQSRVRRLVLVIKMPTIPFQIADK